MEILKEEIKYLPTQPWTKSWHPVPHTDCIENVDLAIKNVGLEVMEQKFEVDNTGYNIFAQYYLDPIQLGFKNNDKTWIIAFRNSNNKSYAFSITAGTHVFICANGMLNSESMISYRRHTSGLNYDMLKDFTQNAIYNTIEEAESLQKWHNNLLEYKTDTNQEKILTYDFMKNGVFAPSKFNEFNNSLNEEKKLNGNCAYSIHGAATRLFRNIPAFNLPKQSKKLNETINDFIDVEFEILKEAA